MLGMELPDYPRLRGIFHQYAFFAALAGGIALVVLAEGARARFACAVYAAALAAMFGMSAVYHRRRGALRAREPGLAGSTIR